MSTISARYRNFLLPHLQFRIFRFTKGNPIGRNRGLLARVIDANGDATGVEDGVVDTDGESIGTLKLLVFAESSCGVG